MFIKSRPIIVIETVTKTSYSNPFSRFLNELKRTKKLSGEKFVSWLLGETMRENLRLSRSVPYFWMAGKGYPPKKNLPVLSKIFSLSESAVGSLIPDERNVFLDQADMQHLAHVQASEGRHLTIEDVIRIATDHELVKHFGDRFGTHFDYKKN